MPKAAHPPNRDAAEGTQSRVVAFPRSPEEERTAHTLPLELTSFIGRQREIAAVKHLQTAPGSAGGTSEFSAPRKVVTA